MLDVHRLKRMLEQGVTGPAKRRILRAVDQARADSASGARWPWISERVGTIHAPLVHGYLRI
jgi:hypothetical protein